jgi:hypothetical protein
MSNDYSEFGLFANLADIGIEETSDFATDIGRVLAARPQSLQRIADQVEARRAELRGEALAIKDRPVTNDALLAALKIYEIAHVSVASRKYDLTPEDAIPRVFKEVVPEDLREEYIDKAVNDLIEDDGEAATEEAVERTKYGSVRKAPSRQKTEDIREFTPRDAGVLVNEIHSDFIGRVDLTPVQQQEARLFIENNLFNNLAEGDDGFIRVNEEHSFPLMDSSISGMSGLLNLLLEERATEVLNDPRHLLKGNKFKLALDIAWQSGVISDEERNILDTRTENRTPEQSANVIAWYGELEEKLTSEGGWLSRSINRQENLESVLRKEMPKNLGGDPHDPSKGKRPGMMPFGYVDDAEAARARRAAQADMEALGQGKKSEVEDAISRYSSEIDKSVFGSVINIPEIISDSSLKAAVKSTNAIVRAEYEEYIRTLPDTMTDMEKGELGEQWLGDYFAPIPVAGVVDESEEGARAMGKSRYVTSVTEQAGNIGTDKLSTDTGRKNFLKDKYPLDWDNLSPEYQRMLKAEIAFKSFDEAGEISDARISEYAELSKQQKTREDRESYDLSAAKKDFNKWYWDQQLDVDDLDPDELERWHKKTLREGGVEGLLRSQELALGGMLEAEGRMRGKVDPAMVAGFLVNNIQQGNISELEADDQARREAFNLSDANKEYKNLTALLGLTPEQSTAVRGAFAPQIAKALAAGEFSLDIQNEIAAGMKAALDANREEIAFKAINKDFSSFALGLALNQGIIGPDTSQGFMDRFQNVTIPQLQNAIFQRGISSSAGMEDLIIGSLKPDEMTTVTQYEALPSKAGGQPAFATEVEVPVGRPGINLSPVNINEEAYNEYISPDPGTPGSELPADQRLYFLDLMEEAQSRGQGVNALGQIVPFTPAQIAAGQTQNINEVLGSISAQTNATAFPAFPTGEHIPEFGQISSADLRAGMDRARQARIESEASLDIAGARTELERLQAARAAEGIEIPEIEGYDEAGRPTFAGLAVGSDQDKFIRGLMDRSRRGRMRQEEDRAYRRSIQQQVPVGAGEFAGAIQQAAGEDLGFQRYLLGQSEAVRRRFERVGGRTAKAPRDFSDYFVGEELPELRRQYTESPEGIASELGRMETEKRETEREEADSRRRSFRRGRTVMRI